VEFCRCQTRLSALRMTEQNIRVGVRFRALTVAERERGEAESWQLDEKTSTVTQILAAAAANASATNAYANTAVSGAAAAAASSKAAPLQFRFNGDVFGADACNKKVYTTMCKDIISSGMRGVNGMHLPIYCM
jgi:hypothetical protein